MPKIIESFEEFAARQGCEYVTTRTVMSPRTVREVYRVLFANGAVSWGGNHMDPPSDTRARLKLVREYVECVLKREEKAFKEFKAHVLDQTELHKKYPANCPAPSPRALTQLENGKARVEKLREELKALTKQLDREQPDEAARREQAKSEQAAEQAERYEQLRDFAAEVSRVTI